MSSYEVVEGQTARKQEQPTFKNKHDKRLVATESNFNPGGDTPAILY